MTVLDPSLKQDFRTALGHFATGLCVLTSPGPAGMTVQSMMSLSLEPPLLALGISRRSTLWEEVRHDGVFCLNLLRADQEDLVWRFGSTPRTNRFDGVAWHPAPDGIPELAKAHAWIRCRMYAENDGGDHWLVVARVDALRLGVGDPLIFHRGRLGRLAGS